MTDHCKKCEHELDYGLCNVEECPCVCNLTGDL